MLADSLCKLRREVGVNPIFECQTSGAIPLFVERYLYQKKGVSAPEIPHVVLVTFFGGSTAAEGETGQLRNTLLPTQSMLIPANVATEWHFSGTVDFALFYLLSAEDQLTRALSLLAESRDTPMLFSDQFVLGAGRLLLNELQKESITDAQYDQLLIRVMFEQTFRALTTPTVGSINPRHAQYSRLQLVLNYVHANLAGDLSVKNLAGIAGVDVSYFRKIFHDATGAAPHDYVLSARLEHARKLLTMSALPIIQIAEDCGFANQSHLTARFRAAHAITPAKFRREVAREDGYVS
jgi:AraC family transcriptional regulator